MVIKLLISSIMCSQTSISEFANLVSCFWGDWPLEASLDFRKRNMLSVERHTCQFFSFPFPSITTYLPTYLPSSPPISLPLYLTSLPPSLPHFLPPYLPTYISLPTFLPPHLPTYVPTHLLASLPLSLLYFLLPSCPLSLLSFPSPLFPSFFHSYLPPYPSLESSVPPLLIYSSLHFPFHSSDLPSVPPFTLPTTPLPLLHSFNPLFLPSIPPPPSTSIPLSVSWGPFIPLFLFHRILHPPYYPIVPPYLLMSIPLYLPTLLHL